MPVSSPPSPEDAEGRALQTISPEHLPPLSSSLRVMAFRRWIDPEAQSRIALCREGGAPYTPREIRMATLTLEAVPWLHWEKWPPPKTASGLKPFSPRLKLVLELLLKGFSRKEIADHIGIAHGTVNGYAKELYRHYGVKSQANLMKVSPHSACGK